MKNIVYLMMTVMAVLVCNGCAKEEKNTVMDAEGNVYKTRNYGGTWWMVENMRTTKTKDGRSILVSTSSDTYSYTSPYCYYVEDKERISKKEGCLYNWTAATQVCPEGWHLPTVDDYENLTEYMGSVDKYCFNGDPNAIAQAMASKEDWENITEWMYSSGISYKNDGKPGSLSFYTAHLAPGTYSHNSHNNASGFNARPAGYVGLEDSLVQYGRHFSARFWLLDESDGNYAQYFWLKNDTSTLLRSDAWKICGFSVRCVKY